MSAPKTAAHSRFMEAPGTGTAALLYRTTLAGESYTATAAHAGSATAIHLASDPAPIDADVRAELRIADVPAFSATLPAGQASATATVAAGTHPVAAGSSLAVAIAVGEFLTNDVTIRGKLAIDRGAGKRPYYYALPDLFVARRLIARDTFTRADSTPLGSPEIGPSPWVALKRNWGVTAGQAYSSDGGLGDAVAVMDTHEADVRLDVDITAGLSQGIAFRVVDVSNFFLAWLTTNDVRLIVRNAGTFTTLVTTTHNIGAPKGALTVNVYADKIQVLLDGSIYITYTLTAAQMSTFGTATRHGLRTDYTESRFDNWHAKPSSGPVTAGVVGGNPLFLLTWSP